MLHQVGISQVQEYRNRFNTQVVLHHQQHMEWTQIPFISSHGLEHRDRPLIQHRYFQESQLRQSQLSMHPFQPINIFSIQ